MGRGATFFIDLPITPKGFRPDTAVGAEEGLAAIAKADDTPSKCRKCACAEWMESSSSRA